VKRVIQRKNGDFLPSFTVDGLVAGTWSVTKTAEEATLELAPTEPVPRAARSELTEEAEWLVRFIGRDAARHNVRWAAAVGG